MDILYNWWGSNNPEFLDLLHGLCNYSPWLYMTINADPATINYGENSQITASFNNLFNGTTITPLNPMIGHIPDGTIITFNTDKGSITPLNTQTINGTALSTFTGTAVGTITVSASLDQQNSTTTITIPIPPAPIASFTANITDARAPVTVLFNNTSTGFITSYAWDFNANGNIDSTQREPSFTYTRSGIYTVILTVTGPGGTSTMARAMYITVRLPDIVTQSVDTPSSVRRGQNLRVNSILKNEGNISTGKEFYVALYLRSTRNSKIKYYIGRYYVPNLGAGETNSNTSYFRISRNIPRGRYYVMAVADHTRSINVSWRNKTIKYRIGSIRLY